MHGGSVAVESEGRDRGSRFTIKLPVTDCIIKQKDNNRVIAPKGRKELIGIHPVSRVEKNVEKKEVEYTSNIGDSTFVFDEDIVFSTEYGSYNEVFKSIFTLYGSLIENINSEVSTSRFLQVIAPDNFFSLGNNDSQKENLTNAFANIVNGNNTGIITTNKYQLNLESITQSGTLQQTGLELLMSSLSFITNIPRSVLMGEQIKGWASNSEEDRIKYEIFLKSLAENYFLPIMHKFCKICKLSDWKNLQYKTVSSSREKLDIYTNLVPDEFKTPERELYIGMEIDKILGIDSKTKSELQAQLNKGKVGVEEDSQEDLQVQKKTKTKSKAKKAKTISS
jgi:hypothetical protein